MARIAGKLTGKSLGWDRPSVEAAVGRVPATGGRVFIGRIVGTVTGLHDTFDEEKGEVQTGLKGEFKGISSLNEFVPKMDPENPEKPVRDDKDQIVMLDTGEPITVTAGRCYLPSGLQDMLEKAYKEAAYSQETRTVDGETKTVTIENKGASVTFGLDLYAVPAKNKAGYTYDGDTVMEAAANNPMDMLLQSAAAVKPLPGRAVNTALTDQSGGGDANTTTDADQGTTDADKSADKAPAGKTK